MKAVLGPLATVPGVQIAMLVSEDGVPIVVRGESRQGESRHEGGKEPSDGGTEQVEDADVLAALTAGWISEVGRAIAPISWSAPRHLVLRASRGTLIAMQAPRALLVVVLGRGMQPSELRIPMESAIARMERGLRGNAQRRSVDAGTDGGEERANLSQPGGIFPARQAATPSEADAIDIAKNGNTEPYGPPGE